VEVSDPPRASARWQSIDRQLTDAAIWVPTVNERQVDLVSRRLRNYEYNPVWDSSPTKPGSDSTQG
jgi:hypothetical protein